MIGLQTELAQVTVDERVHLVSVRASLAELVDTIAYAIQKPIAAQTVSVR